MKMERREERGRDATARTRTQRDVVEKAEQARGILKIGK
jgi:hypothetical protein